MKKRCLLLVLISVMGLGLSACSLPSTPPDATEPPESCADTVAAIAESQEFEELTPLSENQIHKYLELNDGTLADMAMSIDASNATAETIAILQVSAESFADTTYNALIAYRDATLETYRDYQPDEVPKLENAIIKRNGLKFALVVCKDVEAAEKALTGLGWK